MTVSTSAPATVSPATVSPATVSPATLSPATVSPVAVSPATLSPVTVSPVAGARSTRRRPVRWISSPRFDLTLAALWVPFAAVGWAVSHGIAGHGVAGNGIAGNGIAGYSDPGSGGGLAYLLAATLTFSALHQPLKRRAAGRHGF